MKTAIAHNPIMPGFYPDPSICAVGEDFYLVCSSFAYFPGLPILHSKDLAHWEQIGNVMTRNSQLPLKNAGHSNGLFAPTIRYNNGTFYVICTNVTYGGNYIVTATNPEGPWSEPYYIEGADGIDPSLFFDDDGKCYYIGTHPNPDGCRYDGDWYIWIQELDTEKMELVGEKKNVWNGAMRDIIWPEGPHLYKKDGYYYIMHAEGGTGPDHAVTVCRSKDIFGPYQNNFCNPILTHRHLGQAYPIKYVGHADLVQDVKGDWYIVMLAVRPKEGYTTMGRETFLAKVTWENDWPVVNVGVGILTEEVETALPEWDPLTDPDSYTSRTKQKTCVPGSSRRYEFAKMAELGDEFLFLRNPEADMCTLEQGKGLMLTFGAHSLKEKESPSFVAIRQQHHHFHAATTFSVEGMTQGKKAGIVLMQNNTYHLRVECDETQAEVIACLNGDDEVLLNQKLSGGEVSVTIQVQDLKAKVTIQDKATGESITTGDIDVRLLSTEVAGGFVGCTVGVYALATGADNDGKACFTELEYVAE